MEEVKHEVYRLTNFISGLVDVARKNLDLLDPILDLLHRQLDQYLDLSEPENPNDRRRTLRLEHVLVGRKDGVDVMEPLVRDLPHTVL